MRAYELGPQTGWAGLRQVQRPMPEPGPGEVLIRVRACGLNNRDLRIAQGQYGERKPPHRIPLSDGAGDIVALGPQVEHLQVGDRVTAAHLTQWLAGEHPPPAPLADLGQSVDGWLAEYVCLPASALVRLPDSMTYEEAAVCPTAGVGAWYALRVLAKTRVGDRVLVLGTGGVAIWALQIAHMFGARVVITSSSDEKLAVAKRLGADHRINYLRQPDWHHAVMDSTGGLGVDVVIETMGLATLDQSIACCAPMARIALLGATGGQATTPASLYGLMGKHLVMQGVTSGSRRMLQDLIQAMHLSDMRPLIHSRHGFDAAPAAYAALAAVRHVGKIVIHHD